MGLLPYALHNLLLSKYALLYCEYLLHAVVLSPQLDSHQAQIAWAVGKALAHNTSIQDGDNIPCAEMLHPTLKSKVPPGTQLCPTLLTRTS